MLWQVSAVVSHKTKINGIKIPATEINKTIAIYRFDNDDYVIFYCSRGIHFFCDITG